MVGGDYFQDLMFWLCQHDPVVFKNYYTFWLSFDTYCLFMNYVHHLNVYKLSVYTGFVSATPQM